MQISVFQDISVTSEVLVIPITKQGNYEETIARIALKTGIPAGFLQKDFKADHKETHILYFQDGKKGRRLLLLGLGENPTFAQVLEAFRSFTYNRKESLPEKVGIRFLSENSPENLAVAVEAAVNGMLLGRYDIGLYKTGEKEKMPFLQKNAQLDIFVESEAVDIAKKAVEKGKAVSETQLKIFDLVNAPSNKKTPQVLADWATQSGNKFGFDVRVFDKKEIEEIGLNALLAVNRGSEHPPTFIVMEYKPVEKKEENLKKIGLVGKGVTFDTGGLSLKPSSNMHYMKSDMGGAGAVLGAMELVARFKLPIHLIGIVPATDNSVDALSIKPSDVIESFSGKSIEIIDTDAEGRLILADGLSFLVKQFQPDVLIDLATLTGSCIRTLGDLAGGLFTNNDSLSNQLLEAGKRTGERLWRLPLWDDYSNYIKSDVADVKNFSGKPMAGAITAAKFLEIFTEDHKAWAHLDIAGVAASDSEFSSQKSATGFGVRLLVDYLSNLK